MHARKATNASSCTFLVKIESLSADSGNNMENAKKEIIAYTNILSQKKSMEFFKWEL